MVIHDAAFTLPVLCVALIVVIVCGVLYVREALGNGHDQERND